MANQLRILIAPDKFKGTLTADQAAEAIAQGWQSVRPGDALSALPISDGGDGFGELLGRHLRAEERTTATVDAAHEPIKATWWWEPRRRIALIESARVIGLARLPKGKFHPFELDTLGLGRVIQDALAMRPRDVLIGIGGSATNDAGFGLATGLGWRFLDNQANPIESWPELTRSHAAQPPSNASAALSNASCITVAVDVKNPLLGGLGASRVYGPQKGLRPEDFAPAEAAFRALVRATGQGLSRFKAPHRIAGAGAAGGLGYGLTAFAGARLRPGFQLFAREVGMRSQLEQSDLLITGEGALDRTSVDMGKGVGELAWMARNLGVPCLGLAGKCDFTTAPEGPFTRCWNLAPSLAKPEEAMERPAHYLKLAAAQAAQWWNRHGTSSQPPSAR